MRFFYCSIYCKQIRFLGYHILLCGSASATVYLFFVVTTHHRFSFQVSCRSLFLSRITNFWRKKKHANNHSVNSKSFWLSVHIIKKGYCIERAPELRISLFYTHFTNASFKVLARIDMYSARTCDSLHESSHVRSSCHFEASKNRHIAIECLQNMKIPRQCHSLGLQVFEYTW